MPRKRTADVQVLQNAVKTLAANIRFASVDNPVRTICVTSSIPSEGKTTTSVALSNAFAEGGSRVILLECDMRRRSLATAIGHHGRYGLYSVLAGEHSVQEAAVPVGTSKRLFFLDAEPGIPNPADVLQSKRFHTLLAQLSSQFDYTIVDTPPVTAFVDAAVAASVVDATILVVRQDYTHRDDVVAAYEQLVQAGANVIGTVLNCCDAATSGHYYGYYKERRNDSYDVVAPSADTAQPLGAAPASAPVEPARPASNRVSLSVSGARSPRPIPAGGVATGVKPVNSSVRSQRAAGQNGLDQTSAFQLHGVELAPVDACSNAQAAVLAFAFLGTDLLSFIAALADHIAFRCSRDAGTSDEGDLVLHLYRLHTHDLRDGVDRILVAGRTQRYGSALGDGFRARLTGRISASSESAAINARQYRQDVFR